ncbi:unnamed protein product [Clonostachys rosea f. rosea IK726]|uniref:Uncharacterized protein n=1 Tax=Clonostachys rosea f. rosea IK726 TaxID=1349383 RepID=A0ACA9TN99_BIOOC|nr:unnamed protein product [Clonostachys rosea f. rosea IK726]
MDDNPPEQEVNAEFDPDRCALLHNELLSRAVGHIPDAAENMQQNCIQIALGNPPGWADTDALQNDDIVRFFSQLNVYDPRHAPFTGEFRQPDAVAFWNRTYGDMNDPDIILLYPTAFDIQQDAGLFLDLFTKRVTYGNMECGSLPASHSESWVPLEFALLKLLEMWDRGKYYWMDDSRSSILMRGFTPGDLEETLSAWEGLLEAIQTRLGDRREDNYRDPLPISLVNRFKMSPFAKAFLTRAKRPNFTFVGPGITVFTDVRFEATMSSELPDSERSQFIKKFPDEPDLYPSLILPLADESVRLQTPFTIRERHLERLTISLLPGLYTAVDDKFADTIQLVTAQATDRDMVHNVQRPWGIGRAPRFAEIFEVWAGYVIDGIWEVGVDGVSTNHGWFTDAETKVYRELHFMEDSI